jgi:ribonucleoside-diphosphate reductase alpha chain
MKDQGVPHEACVMKPDTTTVFSFPIKSPKNSVTRNDMTAIEQLEMWLAYQRHWCEHKPSITCTVLDSEWMAVGAFVYEHFDEMSGVSFLPPYQEVDKDAYDVLLKSMPKKIDWAGLSDHEKDDNTNAMQTLACSGDSCEMVDIS